MKLSPQQICQDCTARGRVTPDVPDILLGQIARDPFPKQECFFGRVITACLEFLEGLVLEKSTYMKLAWDQSTPA